MVGRCPVITLLHLCPPPAPTLQGYHPRFTAEYIERTLGPEAFCVGENFVDLRWWVLPRAYAPLPGCRPALLAHALLAAWFPLPEAGRGAVLGFTAQPADSSCWRMPLT